MNKQTLRKLEQIQVLINEIVTLEEGNAEKDTENSPKLEDLAEDQLNEKIKKAAVKEDE